MRYFLGFLALLLAFSSPAYADGRLNKNIREYQTYSGAPASGDYIYMFDASADEFKKIDARTQTIPNLTSTSAVLTSATIPTLNSTTSTITTGNLTTGNLTTGNITTLQGMTTVDPSGTTYKAALTGNPLIQGTYNAVTLSELNAGKVLLTATASKTIIPRDWQLYSSGTMAGLSTVVLECSGGTDIASIAVGALTDGAVIGPYTSGVTLSTTAVKGCPSGEGVQIAKTGSSGTTSSHVYVKLGYTWQ